MWLDSAEKVWVVNCRWWGTRCCHGIGTCDHLFSRNLRVAGGSSGISLEPGHECSQGMTLDGDGTTVLRTIRRVACAIAIFWERVGVLDWTIAILPCGVSKMEDSSKVERKICEKKLEIERIRYLNTTKWL